MSKLITVSRFSYILLYAISMYSSIGCIIPHQYPYINTLSSREEESNSADEYIRDVCYNEKSFYRCNIQELDKARSEADFKSRIVYACGTLKEHKDRNREILNKVEDNLVERNQIFTFINFYENFLAERKKSPEKCNNISSRSKKVSCLRESLEDMLDDANCDDYIDITVRV